MLETLQQDNLDCEVDFGERIYSVKFEAECQARVYRDSYGVPGSEFTECVIDDSTIEIGVHEVESWTDPDLGVTKHEFDDLPLAVRDAIVAECRNWCDFDQAVEYAVS